MNYFEKKGRELLANGYLIVPIRPGEKRPALASWQHSRLSAVDLPRYPGCGDGREPTHWREMPAGPEVQS